MRRTAAALLALSTALVLTSCSSSGDDATDSETLGPTVDGPSEADIAALDAVVVEGDVGSEPTLTFDLPFDVSSSVTRVDVPGEGDALETGQRVAVNYVVADGDDGSVTASTWSSGTTENLSIGDPDIITELNDLLVGQNIGARVLLAVPGGEATEDSEAYAASVIVLEIVGVVASQAEGEAVTPPDDLPIVTLAEDGTPSIEIAADTEDPTELTAQTLIKGAGAEVESGQTIVVQYTGWLLDGTEFDTSWDNRVPLSTEIGTGSVITGWDEGLVGQTVGSQVLLVIPSDLGYGAEGSGSIPADASLIFVVDILEAY